MSADTDMVENAARAIRNRAEQPIDMAEARYLARAALDASGIGELESVLERLSRRAAFVMQMLEDDGPNVVPHLIDTDDNPGEYLRQTIAEADAALSRARATVGNKDE